MNIKVLVGIIIGVLIIGVGLVVYSRYQGNNIPAITNLTSNKTQQEQVETSDQMENQDFPQVSVVAEGLDTPWGLVFLPNGEILVTERVGRVRLINGDGKLLSEPIVIISNAKEIGEGGLLGIAIHPDFSANNFVYFYYTFSNSGDSTLNRVVRMTFKNSKLSNEQIIVDNIPGASNHNGGRIKFGPDKNLYIGTGDAENPSAAQDKNSLAGKILRVTDSGQSAPGNPFNTQIYSYGHRNVQGLSWDNRGKLWSTEHGPSGGVLGTGNDELNLIGSGKNYGWPEIKGIQSKVGMETPIKTSGSAVVWAPSGMAFVNNSIFFAGLRGEALYEAEITNEQVLNFREHFKGKFGRIREIVAGPDNMLYITTSNKDGRGVPALADDRIIRINPHKL